MTPENKRKEVEGEDKGDSYQLIMEAIITGNIHLFLKKIAEW